MVLKHEDKMNRSWRQSTGRFAQLAHSMGLFKFLNGVDDKDTVKSLFNRPKIISCQKWTIGVRVRVIATSERSKLVIRRSKIIFKHFLIEGLK